MSTALWHLQQQEQPSPAVALHQVECPEHWVLSVIAI